MLKRYMHKRERHFAMLNDNRVVREFDWGKEFVGGKNGDDPRKIFARFSADTIASSDNFFSSPTIAHFDLDTGSAEVQILSWTSGVTTPSPENNTAYATYF